MLKRAEKIEDNPLFAEYMEKQKLGTIWNERMENQSKSELITRTNYHKNLREFNKTSEKEILFIKIM